MEGAEKCSGTQMSAQDFLANRRQRAPRVRSAWIPRQWRGAGPARDYAMTLASSRFANPQGWQTVAGGRSAAETSGSVTMGLCILKGCQRSATPSESAGHFERHSGGIALLNPRLLSGKPAACSKGNP